jgi:predicted Fe-Mo cluster-binding NifX family protein
MSHKENVAHTKLYDTSESHSCTYTYPKYKIAVASSDGKFVNQHFGHSKQFIIFEVDESGKWSFNEVRITKPVCSNGEHKASSMHEVAVLLSDCKAVVVSQIGVIAEQALKAEGITAYSISEFIDTAIAEVMVQMKCSE